MSKTTAHLVVVLFGCLALLLPSVAQAEGYTYDLVLQAKLENGQKIDLPGFPITDFPECLYQKKRVQIGRKFPRGTIVTPGGNTPSGTITGARCVQRLPKMGE
jgi:hypothetical protein